MESVNHFFIRLLDFSLDDSEKNVFYHDRAICTGYRLRESGEPARSTYPDTMPNAHLHSKIMSSAGVLIALTLGNGHFLWMISCPVGALIPAKAQISRMTCYPKETNIEGSN